MQGPDSWNDDNANASLRHRICSVTHNANLARKFYGKNLLTRKRYIRFAHALYPQWKMHEHSHSYQSTNYAPEFDYALFSILM
eukprot:c19555_g3_i1 orf=233-481(+)